MGLEEFWNDLNNDEYWENSTNTGSDGYTYSSYTDEYGKSWSGYHSGSLTIEKYKPKQRINIKSVLAKIQEEEKRYANLEDYENAAIFRDKWNKINLNSELLIKLYDLKKRAVANADYNFANKVKKKIQKIINGN